MKALAVSLTALLVLAGCSRESPRGGPGAKSGTTTTTTNDGQTQTRTDTETTNRAETFTVKVPTGATNVTQGKSTEMHISLDRGRDFRQAVKVKIDAPKGVKVNPSETTIAGSDSKLTVNVEATDEASVGRHTLTVTGTPETGKAASVNMDIDVKKRD